MNRQYLDYLQEMLENAQLTIRFVKGMDFATFKKDNKTVYAVIRAAEVIGEAASNVPIEKTGATASVFISHQFCPNYDNRHEYLSHS